MVYGTALEKREWLFHLVPPDTILCCPAHGETDFCIWQCHPVPLGTKQFVGKMSAKCRQNTDLLKRLLKVKGRDF